MRVSERHRPLRAALAIAIGCVASVAVPARAATVPSGSIVRVDRPIDVTAFARAVAIRYHVVLQRVVAADIDRDGDLDVLASTDRGFLVWVNDGHGRLTSQAPKPHPALDGDPPADTWNGSEPRDHETVQNGLRSLQLPDESTHAPPVSISQPAASTDIPLCAPFAHAGCAPRAPPAVSF
ncbi:MAG: hypothetical protein AUH43_11620 [Acidobacteria bacterium 13_1_40CM_65_14]|nr:MAG: hypothetical protein AUH43_11620 [Acidobacteria bacterium 13_1_40CM_65_14]OLC80052.1 MAG: hypothetical protein AUH72_12875 [Acidobacteria bacterium 13_1_40CM_4_65_8]OLD18711.1 MAG: hypothetical protein AUJ01_07040 [Acidobacteria bacterium 13_1_40CM_3_65_5]OLE85470.1 MAG: hypothetical protein AUF76_00610 [Acidobacteria bacterium 13_1_20CM_2_65_9]